MAPSHSERDDLAPTENLTVTKTPQPETRRARRLAEKRRRAVGAFGMPGPAVKTLRLGVLGAVVVGTGAFTVSQVSASPRVTDPHDLAAVEAGTLSLRDGGSVASRSQMAGRTALEADGAHTFSVVVDGQTREITSTADSLGEALAEAGIVIGADDVVSAPLADAVPAGEQITVQRATTDHVTEREVDEFEVVEEEDPSLPEGEREVEVEGRDGVTTSTYRVVTAGGEEISRQLVATVETSERRDKVVRIGTGEEESVLAEEAEDSVGASGGSYSGDPRSIAQQMLPDFGWGADQFSCLDSLWQRESNWNPSAQNPSSGAYGIPQALPGSKMASAGSDWATNPATQIEWGLGYIQGRYGSPCGAWGHSQSNGWY
ncbi:G5 domain-containing protein [Georgenia deserti]|uniref:G5 domain-containing protein n=1 Tax=Georgenia deserti TaxID=2093781 RepID=A0ABW4L0P2_9MICO